ncbi:hypothetical protein A3H65_01335 [Candidatus Giovannonibacteria bacterium RIFCSPLOWO2_02_FULL_45_14]|uniref:Type 4 fimbrial biogenesis protein PilX N-terminal domain-containing protein n=1 Tax=Candidatus Giovannonibacteria bacterium RIFCSPLOWO2_12_FULL_44_15 TaxID=1798364 RepID=A0A1F5Y1Q2_9BACT|nr:MAG: hypothetical protein A3C75_00925 [Candidatus Giovannonibacteria bacterium RIFCSPHIGHO2_02_FULL_44_31]OGF76422.1 MAG: hypothetical protein A3E62_00905 [Candidatus Giovannonibacteria bacterium RIFCSPHIGHO2_12_FULL_44_29]OGF91094.1 MAG: hypothetical protein A3H65_01335 [Candidatus Giovannonibacteria bacterium RIFCSPLOWO2_02_FULL_45_14]OGF93791.1 MAG: hypothetical protein A3G54_02700 [Candidatus Giovannonibacteria bacterium RIFCSPLOWO2_12_FULL_44_15]
MIYSKGIALLLSIILVSIVLAVSVGVSNIVSTEISLSNTGRQSQVAFYAADAGVDCAIYWDTLNNGDPGSAFATTNPDTFNNLPNACAGDSIQVGGKNSCVNSAYPQYGDGSSSSPCGGAEDKRGGKSVFTLSFENGSCAIVTVLRRQDSLANPTSIETFIHSDGHSSGDANCLSNNPRVFQRSIETTSFGD